MIGEQINIECKGAYAPAQGSFGFLDRPGSRCYEFNTCRNVFHSSIESKLRAAICEGNVEQCCSVSEFVYVTGASPIVFDATMNGIEDHFDLTTRSTVRPTNFPFILMISPAPFWVTSSMRFSLFTILARAIHRGFQKPFGVPSEKFDWQILLQETYLDKTRKALMEFFGGKTYCDFMSSTYSHGWYELFKGEHSHVVEQNLLDARKFTAEDVRARTMMVANWIKSQKAILPDSTKKISADDIDRWSQNVVALASRR